MPEPDAQKGSAGVVQFVGAPPVHAPAWHLSSVVQGSPSLHCRDSQSGSAQSAAPSSSSSRPLRQPVSVVGGGGSMVMTNSAESPFHVAVRVKLVWVQIPFHAASFRGAA
ncbi:MAG: hypothetical protein AMXMBFR34_31640 [Myxococcaceae bacterium]